MFEHAWHNRFFFNIINFKKSLSLSLRSANRNGELVFKRITNRDINNFAAWVDKDKNGWLNMDVIDDLLEPNLNLP